VNVEILGVNWNASAADNDLITSLTRLPWLQDTLTNSVWDLWQVTYRDVRILDSQNHLFAVYNLTQHDLASAANRATLRQLFLDAARFVDTDGDGLRDDWEMLNFGNLSATPEGDADGDGQNNFTEYAFGTNPKDARSKTSFQSALSGTGSARSFRVAFGRRAGAAVDYLIESSSDLQQWSAVPGTIDTIEPFRNLFDGTGTGITVLGLSAPNDLPGPAFLRVRAVPRTRP
jgi:hypothetical protein